MNLKARHFIYVTLWFFITGLALGATPSIDLLRKAVVAGDMEQVKYLIEVKGMKPRKVSEEMVSLLFLSIDQNDLETTKVISENYIRNLKKVRVDRQALRNVKSRKDLVLKDAGILAYAICKGNLPTVRYFLDNYSLSLIFRSSTWMEFSDLNPLEWAVCCGNTEVVKYLIEECEQDPHKDGAFNYIFTDTGDVEILKYLIENHGEKAKKEEDWMDVMLLKAARSGTVEMVQYLIEVHNADSKAKSNDGWGIFKNAAYNLQYMYSPHKYDFPVLEYLLNHYNIADADEVRKIMLEPNNRKPKKGDDFSLIEIQNRLARVASELEF